MSISHKEQKETILVIKNIDITKKVIYNTI